MLLFNTETGFPVCLLFDNGYLTNLRTGTAGGVAAKYLAGQKINQVSIIGSGSQGRFQLNALSRIKSFSKVRVWEIPPENVEQYILKICSP